MTFNITLLSVDSFVAATPALGHILQACVAGGAAVGFIAPLHPDAALDFWRGQAGAVAAGEKLVLLATSLADGRALGTVTLIPAPQVNGRHRAEIAKMLVHPDARRQGIAAALLHRAEELARANGRRMLVLDTRQGDDAERLYARLGWQSCGIIPDYALNGDGTSHATHVMYRCLPGSVAGLTLEPSAPSAAQAAALITALSADLGRRFGSDGRAGFADWDGTDRRSHFILARIDGRAVGCGAVRPVDATTGEVKRMYAAPGTRGVGAAVLSGLEQWARSVGYRRLILETRWANDRAIAFYRRHGYAVIDNYGAYQGRVDSACLAKIIAG